MKHMKTILVTAFEPFGEDTLNPTEIVLGMLPDVIGGYVIRKLVLPVEYGRSADIATSEYDRLKPAAVIMLGQAGGRSAISPETTAINLMDCKEPDNAGRIAEHQRISKIGPDTMSSTLPIGKIVDELTARGIRCEVSNDAGAFVCNSLFYSMLRHNRGEVPTGFIHVPYIKEQGHPDMPFMEIGDICTAIEVIIETISANGEIR